MMHTEAEPAPLPALPVDAPLEVVIRHAVTQAKSERYTTRIAGARWRMIDGWDPRVPPHMGKVGGDVLGRYIEHAKLRAEMSGWWCAGGMLFLGPTGAGKTSLLCWHVRNLLLRWLEKPKLRLPSVLFTRASDLANARRQHALGEGEPEIIRRALSARWLLLDDLGHDKFTDSTLFDVLDTRYQAGLFTWATSGFPLAELERTYDQATLRRILDAGGKQGAIVDCFRGAK